MASAGQTRRPVLLPLYSVKPTGVHALPEPGRFPSVARLSKPHGDQARYRSGLLPQERVLVRAVLPALSHRDGAGLGSWVPGGRGSGGCSVGAMSLATEAPCEQAQRPIESPPTLGPGLSPAARRGRGGQASAQECARSRGRGRGSTKPLSTRAWEGHGPSSLTPVPAFSQIRGRSG